jgi:hypothetical protein
MDRQEEAVGIEEVLSDDNSRVGQDDMKPMAKSSGRVTENSKCGNSEEKDIERINESEFDKKKVGVKVS